MTVSVIVPTYHRDWELKRALFSLANQDFLDFEIIVVDDNCDKYWNQIVQEIVAEFMKAFPDLAVGYIPNQRRMGSACSRNVGVASARGSYITFLDDDDEYLRNKIKRQYEYMVRNHLDYSITNLDLYFESGKFSEHRSRSYIEKTDQESLLEYHLKYHLTGTDTIMITKAYFEQIRGFPPMDVGDEFYLMLRAIENGGRFGYLQVCDVRAYVHTGEGGLSSGEGKISGEKRLFTYKKQYFSSLAPKSIRYIKMRHYAVMCFAGFRMHHYGYFLGYGVLSMLSAPLQCGAMLWSRCKAKANKMLQTICEYANGFILGMRESSIWKSSIRDYW